MQRAWLLPVSVAAVTVALIVSTRPPPAGEELPGDGSSPVAELVPPIDRPPADRLSVGRSPVARSPLDRSSPDGDVLAALDAYVDPDFGFSVAVPADWTAVVVPETDAELETLEPGYAVAFESRPEHDRDLFTDYLMIEILPGDDSGLFETDGRLRRETVIDGHRGWRDALSLPADPDDERALDLIVRQATTSGLGYTIGFYAVARPSRAALIEDAFEAMLRTFRLPRRPFDVS